MHGGFFQRYEETDLQQVGQILGRYLFHIQPSGALPGSFGRESGPAKRA